MKSISITEIETLESEFIIINIDELFTNFKMIDLNALEFAGRKPFRILIIYLLITMGLVNKFRRFISNKTTFTSSILKLKNKNILINLINSKKNEDQLIFTHSGQNDNSSQFIYLVKLDLNLDISPYVKTIKELTDNQWQNEKLVENNCLYISISKPEKIISDKNFSNKKIKLKKSKFKNSINMIKIILEEMRVKHWSKNILVFVPLIAAHKFNSIETWLESLIYFFTISFVASGTYILNDILDLKNDSLHAFKQKRPLVSGDISLKFATRLMLLLLITGFILSIILLNSASTLSLILYVILTLLYSFYLKNMLALDLVILALLHTLRVIGGSLAINVVVSYWMLSFAFFIFFSLGSIKRSVEISDNTSYSIVGRPYLKEDLNVTNIAGISAGIASVLVFALYIQSPEVVKIYYKSPEILLLGIPILMYWVYYSWLCAARKIIQHDPVLWAIRDRGSQVSLILLLLIGIFASLIDL